MTKTVENLFIITATYTPALPLLFFFLFLNSVKKEKILYFLIAYSFAEFVVNFIAYYANKIPIFLYPLFTIIEYSLFASLLFLLIKQETVKKLIIFFTVIFLVFAIGYYFTIKINGLDTIPIGIESILILAYSFFFLYEQMQFDSQELIYNRFSFWIIAGIMLYLGGSSFIYLFANQVDKKTMHIFWTFQNGFAILKNFLFVISIYICFKQSSNHQKKNLQTHFQ
jgi:hypothetical protein